MLTAFHLVTLGESYVQAEEPDAMTEFQKKLLTRFVVELHVERLFVFERRIAAFWPETLHRNPYQSAQNSQSFFFSNSII